MHKKSLTGAKDSSDGGIAISMCKCNDAGSSTKHSCVQLPPKKRKISCDFQSQDRHQLHIVDNEKQHRKSKVATSVSNVNGVGGTLISSSAAIVEIDVPRKIPTNLLVSPVSSNEISPRNDIISSKTTLTKEDAKDSNKKKMQKKYVPDRPMGTEEVKAWRKEARRVRNRQSAAASRDKIRNRIVVLESECQSWRTKYEEVMERIRIIESAKQS